MVYIIKKDGTKEEFDASKIKRAVNKSAGPCNVSVYR